MPTAALSIRRATTDFAPEPSPWLTELPEFAASRVIRLDRGEKILFAEVRPESRGCIVLAVRRLPEKEIGQAHLACRADDEVWIGAIPGKKVPADHGLVDILGLDGVPHNPPHRILNYTTPTVIERHVQCDPRVVSRQLDRTLDLGAQVVGHAFHGPDVANAHPVAVQVARLPIAGIGEERHEAR